MDKQTPLLLLIEDNLAEAELLKRVFQREQINCEIKHLQSGDEALTYLQDPQQRLPQLVLIDLNLADSSGLEILNKIRSNTATAALPVLILTNSRNPDDVQQAYRQHANGYIPKPIGIQQLNQVAHSIEQFWLSVAILP